MKSFLAWLTSPSRAIQQAQSEIEYLRGEVKRLSDLLVQAWELKGVVPVQSQHQQAVKTEPEAPKTLGAMQIKYADQAVADYEAWQRDQQARTENHSPATPVN